MTVIQTQHAAILLEAICALVTLDSVVMDLFAWVRYTFINEVMLLMSW